MDKWEAKDVKKTGQTFVNGTFEITYNVYLNNVLYKGNLVCIGANQENIAMQIKEMLEILKNAYDAANVFDENLTVTI